MSANTAASSVLIVGGGPVGLAAALALDQRGVRATVCEARAQPGLVDDPRVLALSHGTRLILEGLGAWNALERCEAILRIDITQRGGLGRVSLTAAEAALPALGHVVSYGALVNALLRACDSREIAVLAQTRVVALSERDGQVELQVEHAGVTQAQAADVVVQADGASAWLQDQQVLTRDYGQWAVVADVACERGQPATAYERFTPEGPIALLPRGDRFALIWTVPAAQAQGLLQASPNAFVAALYATFGERVGRFELKSAVSGFPLALRFARSVSAKRVVLIGNAAQTLHPVAAQGFNLGIRDAYELASALGRSVTLERALADYQRGRRVDRSGGAIFTDLLVRTFGAHLPLFGAARGAALTLLDSCPPAKRFFLRRMIFGARG